MPAEVSTTRQGFFISGINRSDDLYMYFTKRISSGEGIRAGRTYRVNYEIIFDSNAPSNCIGTGGAPGESVILQAGAINQSPRTFIDELNIVRTKFAHQLLVTSIANGIECDVANDQYVRLNKRQQGSVFVQAVKDGALWLIVGTDSGFESKTALYDEVMKS